MASHNFSHLVRALRNSCAGIARAWANETAFRQEVVVLFAAMAALCFMRPGIVWSVALLGGWLFVMALELLNSAIEEAFNLISPEYNIHVKYGKDMASAAVFVSIVANVLLWAGMLWDVFF